jgi:hypothetical protein
MRAKSERLAAPQVLADHFSLEAHNRSIVSFTTGASRSEFAGGYKLEAELSRKLP